VTPEINRPLPRSWWLQKPAYFKFMIREMTSVAVLAYSMLIIWALWAAADTQSFSVFYDFLRSPLSIGLHAVVFGLAFYHTITWIALTPKVMVEWQGDKRVDPDLIAWNIWLVFVLVTVIVLVLVLA
jgi:fumarate reductase subunit C